MTKDDDRQLRSAALRNADAIFIARQSAERRSEFYLNEGQRLAHMGSWALNASGFFEYWSHELFRINGLDSVDGPPTLEDYLALVHPQDRDRVAGIMAGMLADEARRDVGTADGTRFDGEYRLMMADGAIKHVHVLARASRAVSGNVELLGTVIDITERKQADEERARLEQQLRQAEKMEAVGRLASGIAHDFNNVLLGILGYGEMLFEQAPVASPERRYAENLLAAANRGRALVEQILTYSHSKRGKRAPVDFRGVVGETLDLVQGSLSPDLRLVACAPNASLVVMGDATQLHQVVMNLCSNAIQAVGEVGTVRVALEAAEVAGDNALSHGALKPGRYARLSVEDSGCGMDEATMSRIFEPFFTTKDVGQGTGLGLSIVYAIVTDLGGSIDVKSAVNEGSTFALYLPLARA